MEVGTDARVSVQERSDVVVVTSVHDFAACGWRHRELGVPWDGRRVS